MTILNHRRLLLVSLFFLPVCLSAQLNSLSIAKAQLKENPGAGNWSEADFAEATITDQYISQKNGILHVYLQQQYQGVPVYNAIAGVHMRSADGTVMFSNHRFYDQLAERVTTTNANIPADRAVYVVSNVLGLPLSVKPEVSVRSNRVMEFTAPELSSSPIPAQQVYFPTLDGKLHLSWNLRVDDPRSAAEWNMFVDVLTGEVLNQKDETIYCTFDHLHADDCTNEMEQPEPSMAPEAALAGDGATYFVFPVPVESPIHGNRAYVVDPADPVSSPFGWHDIDGEDGPEYTITRGNNVHAYRDADPDDAPDSAEPDGGEELFFDFPYEKGGNPTENSNASITQLFYMNNIMHDFTYHFGFDEPSGNYQVNNYGNGGRADDPVRAEAQDGSGINNANFTPSQDGQDGKMQMYLWSIGSTNFEVVSPANLATGYSFATAEFGPQIIETITGELISGLTNDTNPNTGCSSLVNADEVAGKIVLIDRGDCFFEEKAKSAEAAGALACVICNNTSGLLQMAGLDSIRDPLIPTIMITQSDCATFRATLENTPIQVSIEAPDYLDSDFDNGIIAHEYGHGVSTRLTGGPASPFCLTNDEQMGEGWSDFFTLITLSQLGAQGVEARSVGTFAAGQNTNGSGIRRQRYSTDMNVNDQTYDDIIGTFAPHPLGEIWAAVLWDIYWAFADKYGYDPDPTNKTAGNNIAIQLMMDGMKFQSCSPGFIDGRDAIIAADLIDNNGENECLLWELFARRGLGWSADQGESTNRNDNVESYDARPFCIQTLKVTKTSTPNIAPGDVFEIEISVKNDKTSAVSDVLVNDIIPAGAQFVAGSVTGGSLDGISDGTLTFDVGTMPPGSSRTIRYQLTSDPALFSTQLFFDGAESGATNWSPSDLSGSDIWRKSATGFYAGEFAWFVPNTARTNDQALRLVRTVTLDGEQPMLRFYHRYDIEPGMDGGMVEFSTNGVSWNPVPEELYFREPLVGRVAFSTFGIGRQKAFWGKLDDYVATYIDMSDYQGERVLFRFRYSSDAEIAGAELNEGWYVDNIEVLNAHNYATEVCVTTAQGDNVCTMVDNKGTIVEPAVTTQTEALLRPAMDLRIFPNPTSDQLKVTINSTQSTSIQLKLTTIDGKLLQQNELAAGLASQTTQIDVSDLVPGIYLLHVSGASDHLVEKVIVQ